MLLSKMLLCQNHYRAEYQHQQGFSKKNVNKPYWRVVSWQGWLGGYLEFFFCIPLFCCWGSTPIFAKANYLCRLSIFNSPGTWATTIQLWGMTECRIFISSHNCMATSPNNGMAAKAWNMQLYMGAVFWTENRLLHKEVKPVPAALPAQCSVLWATSLPWYLDRT